MTQGEELLEPADLYAQYRTRRFRDHSLDTIYKRNHSIQYSEDVAVQNFQSPDRSRHARDMEEASDYPVSAYGAGSSEIDEIMMLIEADGAEARLLDSHFVKIPASDDTSLIYRPIKILATAPSKVLGSLLQSMSGIIGTGGAGKRLVPSAMLVASLAFLSFLVLSRFSFDGIENDERMFSDATQLPQSLLASAGKVEVQLLEWPRGTAGFSTYRISPEMARFRTGSAVARLVVATEAGDTPATESISNELGSLSKLDLGAYIAESVLSVAGTSSGAEAGDLPGNIAHLNRTMHETQPVGVLNWYSMGQIIEAVHLSASLAVALDETSALADSLQRFREIAVVPSVSEEQPVHRLLMDLRVASGKSEYTLADARIVREITSNIKALLY